MYRSISLLASTATMALALCAGSASASTVTFIQPTNTYTLTGALGPDLYIAGGSFTNQGENFVANANVNDIYWFNYTTPPNTTAVSVTTDNKNPPANPIFGIDNFKLDWRLGGFSQIGGPLSQGTGASQNLTLTTVPGTYLYELILTGTAFSEGGAYGLTITTTDLQLAATTPLPGALALFGSVFAGAAGFMRLRRRSGEQKMQPGPTV